MNAELNLSDKPELVSERDIEALANLGSVYDEIRQADIVVIRDEVVPNVVERSKRIAEGVAKSVGVSATEGVVRTGLLAVSEADKEILKKARRLTPSFLI